MSDSPVFLSQIGLDSAKFLLTSMASLEYDRNQYIFFSVQSNNNPPIHKVITHWICLFVFEKSLNGDLIQNLSLHISDCGRGRSVS